MQQILFATLLGLACMSGRAKAQRFDNLALGVDYPDISDTCADALNSTLSGCPSLLASVALDNPRLTSGQLGELCTSGCHKTLQEVRQAIAKACDQDSDIISYGGVDWPATFVIDRFEYTYDLSCRKDSTSGQFCDEILSSWLNQSQLTSAQNCSDCMLGTVQTQLNSPFGFHEDFAQDFESTTSSCGATNYPYTSPAPYAVNTSATEPASPTNTASCSNPYTVQSGDTCDSIALAKKVPTNAVIGAGGLSPGCTNLNPGTTLCLPRACSLYRVQYDDTCDNILEAHDGLSGVNLLAWNPNINTLCSNINTLAQTLICVGAPGGSSLQVTASAPLAVSSATSPVPKPTNALEESNSRCAQWYEIQEGDYCDSISISQSISLKDLYFLNPELNAECTNLLLGLSYCVKAVGDISTYSGYPQSSQAYSLTSMSFSTTSNSHSSVAVKTTPIVSLPTASGTTPNCADYVDYIPVPAPADQAQSNDLSVITDYANSCVFIISAWGIGMSDFLSWNPSLPDDNSCALAPGYRYCASNSTSNDQELYNVDLCLDVNEELIQSGTIDTCTCYTTIQGFSKDFSSCADVASDSRITVNQLRAWNPWVGSDCDTGLFADLEKSDFRAVCISVNGTTPTTTSNSGDTPSATHTENSSTLSGGATPSPVQSGITKNCVTFYDVKSGDGCYDIAIDHGISLDEFYSYNPAVGDDCSKLYPDNYVCVEVANESCSIEVMFKTTYSTQWGDSVWVVGSWTDWSLEKALMLTGSSGADGSTLWQGTTTLPGNSQYSYKFVNLQADGTPIWEDDPNREFSISSCSGPAMEEGGQWHSGTASPSPTCTDVDVLFEVTVRTAFGEAVYVVGSDPKLGSWSTGEAVALAADDYTEANPLWKGTISLPISADVQYKFIKIGTDGAFTWEADPNRQLTVPSDCAATPVQSGSWQ